MEYLCKYLPIQGTDFSIPLNAPSWPSVVRLLLLRAATSQTPIHLVSIMIY